MRRALLWACLAFALSCSAAVEPRLIDDYFDPPEPARHLEPQLRAALSATPFDCGRYVEQRNTVLSIYRLARTNRYFATVINPYDRHMPREDQLYPFGRFDAELPASTALAIREAWQGMLSRPYSHKSIEDKPVILDGLLAEYSLRVSPFKVLRGTVPNVGVEKYLGPNMKHILKVTLLLCDYCRASPVRRGSLAAKIEREARALTQSLNSTKRSN